MCNTIIVVSSGDNTKTNKETKKVLMAIRNAKESKYAIKERTITIKS